MTDTPPLTSAEEAVLRQALAQLPPDPDPTSDPVSAVRDEWRWYVARLLATLDAERARTADPGGLRETTVIEMENEGVVTWGDERHRARFLASETAAPGLDAARLAEAMKSIDLDMAQMPGAESLADPADDPVRRAYAFEVARRYAALHKQPDDPEAGS